MDAVRHSQRFLISFFFLSTVALNSLAHAEDPVPAPTTQKTSAAEPHPPTDELEKKAYDESSDSPEAQENMTELEGELEKSYTRNKEHKEEVERKKNRPFINPMRPPTLMDIHDAVSDDIVGLSESVDTFFVNDRIIDGRNRTHLRMITTAASIEREGIVQNMDFRLRFRLPRLEEKIQVEINNLDNSFDGDATAASTLENQNLNRRNTDTTAGLSLFKDVLGIRSKVTLGFVFRDAAPFANWRLSKNFLFSKKSNLMLISDVFGDTEDRTGHRGTIYYDYSFHKNLLFRVFNESLYRNEFHSLETQHGTTLYQILNDRHSLAYTAVILSQNLAGQSAYYVNSYDVLTTYRYRIYKNHAFIDAIPRLSFPKRYDFQSNWSFTLRLEIIFGSV